MNLSVKKRWEFGKSLKKYRADWLIPGVVYWKHLESPISVFFDKMEFLKVYEKAWESTPVTLKWDGINQMVLIHEVDVDPVKNRLLHIDFHAVKADEKTEAEVPVYTQWEAPVEKQSLWKIEMVKDHVVVEALPKDLPHDFTLDLSEIKTTNDIVFVKDLQVPKWVEIVDDLEQPIITVVEIKEEPEEEESIQEDTENWEAENK